MLNLANGPSVALQFAFLRELLDEHSTANVCFSPASLQIALAMLSELAVQQTRAVILALLSKESAIVSNTNVHSLPNLTSSGLELVSANSCWFDQGASVPDSCIKRLRDFANTDIHTVNMESDTTLSKINDWVSRKSNRQIQQIVTHQDLQQAVFVLLQVISFVARWQTAFRISSTDEAWFTCSNTVRKCVPKMSVQGSFEYFENEACQAVRLPYLDARFGMLVFLPTGSLTDFLASTDRAKFQEWMGALQSRKGYIQMPPFSIRSQLDIAAMLGRLGIDLSRGEFVTSSGLIRIRQQSLVEADDQGTRAVACTVNSHILGVRPDSRRQTPFRMIVNRPFLFIIRDAAADVDLFMGLVSDPSGKAVTQSEDESDEWLRPERSARDAAPADTSLEPPADEAINVLYGCPECHVPMSSVVHICAMDTSGGDRCIALLRCSVCNHEYIRDWIDTWREDGSEFLERTSGPLPPELANQAYESMALCPEPANKFCECSAPETINEIMQSFGRTQRAMRWDLGGVATGPARTRGHEFLRKLLKRAGR